MSRSIEPADLFSLYEALATANRVGVIPYSIADDRIYWLMGISKHYQWSDFGGGCQTRKKETAYQCLIREVDEESSHSLTREVEESIEQGEGLFLWLARNRQGAIADYLLFVPIAYSDYSDFEPNDEISHLVWLPQDVILNSFLPVQLFHSPIQRYINAFQSRGPLTAF